MKCGMLKDCNNRLDDVIVKAKGKHKKELTQRYAESIKG